MRAGGNRNPRARERALQVTNHAAAVADSETASSFHPLRRKMVCPDWWIRARSLAVRSARLEFGRPRNELEDSDVPPHPSRKIDQEGDLALRMLLAGQLDEGGGLSATGRCLEHDSMAS